MRSSLRKYFKTGIERRSVGRLERWNGDGGLKNKHMLKHVLDI